MSHRSRSILMAAVIILVVTTGAQAATFTRVSPNSPAQVYENHTLQFKVKGDDLPLLDSWQEAQWFIDNWQVGSTGMSGRTDTVTWNRQFTSPGEYQVRARGKYRHVNFLGMVSTQYSQYVTWTVVVSQCDPSVSRVSPDYNVTVYADSSQTFVAEATDPGADLARAVWTVDGVEDHRDVLQGGTDEAELTARFDTPGTYFVGVRVYDAHDFSAYTDWKVKVNAHLPTISRVSPSSPVTVVQGQTTFTAQVTDPGGDLKTIKWYVDGQPAATGMLQGSNQTTTWSYPFDQDGTYTIMAHAWDAAGHSTFTPAEWTVNVTHKNTLTLSSGPGGTVSSPGEGSIELLHGAVIALTATPDPGYTFANWSGSVWSASNPLSVTLTSDQDIKANFEAGGPTERRTLAVSSTAGGSVSLPGEGNFTYAPGSVVAVKATPEASYHFARWTGTAVDAGLVADPNAAQTTVTLDDDGTLMARFLGDETRVNMMPNPSFEIHTDGRYDPDGWGLWGADWQWGGNSTQWWVEDCPSARTGCWIPQLRAGVNAFALADSPRVETLPGELYRVGAWVKDVKPANRPSAVPPSLKFEYFDGPEGGNRDNGQTYAVPLPIPADGQWHYVDVQLNPSTSHPWVQVILLVENWTNATGDSEYLFDDVWFGLANADGRDASVRIAAGAYHSLALASEGHIVGWGYDNSGQASPPPGNDFVAIDAGDYFGLALTSDGTIVGWGYNNQGQASPPPDDGFVAMEAGSFHGLALKTDGSIVGWGANWGGQINMPAGNDFIAVEAGRDHSLALKANGSIVQWGDNGSGQGTPPTGNDFVAISAGSYHSLALKSNGTIVQWGDNRSNQGTPPPGGGFVAIAGGWYHSIALKADGRIVAWGNNDYGQTDAPAGNDFVAITAGASHNLAVKADGTIVGWGRNNHGQIDVPADEDF